MPIVLIQKPTFLDINNNPHDTAQAAIDASKGIKAANRFDDLLDLRCAPSGNYKYIMMNIAENYDKILAIVHGIEEEKYEFANIATPDPE